MTTLLTPSADRASRTLHRAPQSVVITSARTATSTEISARIRHYTLAMAFRMACFVGMIFVDGWLRWVLLAVAVFLPSIAVLAANQADQRTAAPIETGTPTAAPALTAGPVPDDASEIIVIEADSTDEPAPEPWRRAA